MVTKPNNALQCVRVSDIINTVFLLRVSATLVAILRVVYYRGWILQDITKACEPIHRCAFHVFIGGVTFVISCNIHPL